MADASAADPGAASPLLVVCALGIERLALRGGDRGAAAGPVVLLRTGMGPRAAERSMERVLATAAGPGPGRPEAGDAGPPGRPPRPGPTAGHRPVRGPGPAAVIATGFCAGLAPGMHPGDLVVADQTRDHAGSTECTGTEVLASALAELCRRSGRGPAPAVHTGPVAGSDHVVRGAERARLRATGAVAVDMESAATLRTAVRAGPRPVAAVRVVVDAPEHELVRIGTLRGGISAFRVLRSILPAFCQWHRSLPLSRR
ncbi:1-hydroxy-2-methyl-2-butenyl 4-diphosphate reductase [Streptomyces buecherae]|uniref:1-hydroxy-2-methyl-2-butenyl 4-diphosphate reductase n=1 Tax=Streptomyces buecherae TaxID=2763006 RepID=A0A7H8N4M2_9ACTN|nr:1-hydroxy-2-methyl-2-butenyl 4-diphosphate reductase [Streptomyces buecherae]QKW48908.1 1-hydroxy-2-methyl-2-butenyl 4-diphosphate reductase [Streptomyces buecherae]